MQSAAGITASDHFDVNTYAGNGSSSRYFTSLNFQPDFVWIKSRSADPGYSVSPHVLYDSVRGAYKALDSAVKSAEQTINVGSAGSNGLISFESNGFRVGSHHTSNSSLQDYIYWAWKGGGSAVSNTNGSITSSVSANTDAGFSVVSYTGTGANATVGHGLTAAPELVITKSRDQGTYAFWGVYATAVGNTKKLELNDSKEARIPSGDGYNSGTFWNTSDTTSTIFNLGLIGEVNGSGQDFIAYCFHSVDGYQKIGTYEGTNSGGNSITGLGFSPRFVVIKNIDAVGNWIVHSKPPTTTNPSTGHLRFNSSAGTDSGTGERINFDSDGFTLNSTSQNVNTSHTYLYWAIA